MSASRACPRCGERRVVREGMFYYRGTTFSGLVCEKCNALWDNPDDSFEAHVVEYAKRHPVVDPYAPVLSKSEGGK